MATQAYKHLINDPETCVDDMLDGVLAMHPNLKRLKGYRVILREDIEEYKASGKVTLLCGGGSGHEPFAAGYVGKNMLSAAVAGAVFASPPPNVVLAALRALACPAGTLLILINYTGDRLNFGIGVERARAEGCKIDVVTVAEDCALTSTDKTAGRRGLSGAVFIHKIAGTLAEEGKSLEEIVKITLEATQNMGTIGVGLSPCCVPGSGSTFTLGDDEMELGLGIHGEVGVTRMKLTPAVNVAATMINHMTNPRTSSHIKIAAGDKVAIILNNLGGTSTLEFCVMAKEVIAFLENKGVTLERVYGGHFMTSLDMAGVALSILHLDGTRRRCLDAETTAFGWPKTVSSESLLPGMKRSNRDYAEITPKEQDTRVAQPAGADISEEMKTSVVKAVRSACEAIIASESVLNDLDREGGDNDCGTTMKGIAIGILSLCDSFSQMTPYAMFVAMATSIQNTSGGASGALYGLLCTAAATPLQRSTDIDAWVDALGSVITALSKYGGAEPGDRTMLDPLYAAYKVLVSELKEGGVTSLDAFGKAVRAAEESAEATAKMEAKAGRASYVSQDKLTKPDPGATAVAIWMTAIYDILIQ
ncbi:triokinase/FMN cyclase-like [Saccoglossus kowalevskii]